MQTDGVRGYLRAKYPRNLRPIGVDQQPSTSTALGTDDDLDDERPYKLYNRLADGDDSQMWRSSDYEPVQQRSRGAKVCFWVTAIFFVAMPLAGGYAGAKLFSTGIYKQPGTIIKPDWAPPSWLFSPAWVIVYVLMGISSVLVLHSGKSVQVVAALFLYFVHLLVSWSWTPVFFGMGHFAGALAVIGTLLGLVLGLVTVFAPINVWAALLLLPYLVWVAFATVLNYSIVCLNGCHLQDYQHNNTILHWINAHV